MSLRLSVSLSLLTTVVVLFFTAAQGCSLLTKTDRTLIETGGEGGTASTNTVSQGGEGGTTITSGGGGQGGGCTSECCGAADCPELSNECEQRVCLNGKCDKKPVAEGVPTSQQTPGDCREQRCDGQGGVKIVNKDTDIFDDGKQCTVDVCESGAPKNKNVPAGQTCSEGSGIKCDGSGNCAECLGPTDCGSKVCTVIGECAAPECGDAVKNGTETDIDCGGRCGATCATGKSCSMGGDCLNKVCAGTPLQCAAPTCTDGFKNGDETDVDCGGACGATCAPEKGCSKNTDCVGNICSGTVCLPSCIDGVLNNGENAIDCGGPVCISTCPNGTFCVVPSDCTSTFCVDGVCCEAACSGVCSACSAAAKGGGEDGECGAALAQTDPHDDCGIDAPETCGEATGLCDGAGDCEKYPAGTPCDDVASCSAGEQTNADSCDGMGTCSDAGTLLCGLYACSGVTCLTSCAVDTDCAAAAYCAANACVSKETAGQTCAGANQCLTAFCVDGVCCDSACDDICSACSVASGATTNGTCAPVLAGTDPSGDCVSGTTCGGDASCKKLNGEACSLASECLSASCADGFCCNTPCVGLCQACSSIKKGFGSNGSCGFVSVGQDPDSECAGVTSCSGNGTCSLLPTSAICSINGECQSGFCIDGVCCGSVCAGFCQACSAVKTGGADGTCADITVGTDPENECPGTDNCAGNFTCAP